MNVWKDYNSIFFKNLKYSKISKISKKRIEINFDHEFSPFHAVLIHSVIFFLTTSNDISWLLCVFSLHNKITIEDAHINFPLNSVTFFTVAMYHGRAGQEIDSNFRY